jgi:hypothetical protein
MSRLMADQENRGGDGDPAVGEEDSVMRVNLAEGCGAVNDERRWRVKNTPASQARRSCSFNSKNKRNPTNQLTR